jgi:alanyl-tRNA synthetase
VTGDNALAYLQQLEATVGGLAGTLKATPAEVPARVAAVLDHVRALEKEVTALKGRLASAQGDEMLAQAVDVKGVKVLAATLQGADAKALRETLDKLKDKLKSAAIVLAVVEGGKVQLAAGVTADVLARPGTRVKAGELVNFVALQVGGKGGGKPDLAMAGGSDAVALPAALATVAGWVGERL